MTLVVDSSVVLKWYVAEPESERASRLIGRALLAPDLVVAEVANALWKKVQRGEIGKEQTSAVLPHLSGAVLLVPFVGLADRALEIALELRHPVYDCFFLALCEEAAAEMVTADGRLVERCRGTRFGERLRLL